MKIRWLDGKRYSFSGSMFLMRSGCSESRVEGDIGCALFGRSGGDVAAALPIRSGESPAATLLARNAIDRVLQTPRGKCGADFHFVAALPPAGAEGVDDSLFGRLGLA